MHLTSSELIVRGPKFPTPKRASPVIALGYLNGTINAACSIHFRDQLMRYHDSDEPVTVGRLVQGPDAVVCNLLRVVYTWFLTPSGRSVLPKIRFSFHQPDKGRMKGVRDFPRSR